MENNLPTKYKEGIFSKIKNFLKSIFGKKDIIEPETNVIQPVPLKAKSETQENTINIEEQKSKNTITMLREENQKQQNRKKIIDILIESPERIEELSEERLYELDRLCDEEIKENDNEIEYLEDRIKKIGGQAS